MNVREFKPDWVTPVRFARASYEYVVKKPVAGMS
jgi:hypothetical protein